MEVNGPAAFPLCMLGLRVAAVPTTLVTGRLAAPYQTGLSPRWIVSAFLVHLWRPLDSVGSKLGVYLSSGAGKLLANLGQDDTQLADLGTD